MCYSSAEQIAARGERAMLRRKARESVFGLQLFNSSEPLVGVVLCVLGFCLVDKPMRF